MRDGQKWTRRRRRVQIGVVVLFVALPILHRAGFSGIGGTLAGLDVFGWTLVEPAAALSSLLAARHVLPALVIAVAVPVAVALALGPVFCSWICPWGLVSELLDRRRRGSRWAAGSWIRMRRPRRWALGIVLLGSAFAGMPLAALVSPPRLVTSLPVEVVVLGIVSPLTVVLLGALLLYDVAGPRRTWCRGVCPVGAVANALRTPHTLTVVADPGLCRCANCDVDAPAASAPCHVVCRWGIDPRRMEAFDGCTNCLACVDVCPNRALRLALGRKAAA